MQNRIIFIGGGNMARAIFAKLHEIPNLEVIVTQRNSEKKEALIVQYSQIKFYSDIEFEIYPTDLLVLAIKPQDAKITCESILEKLKNNTVISVIAGLSTKSISQYLDVDKIVRVMPNTPSQIGLGVSGIFMTSNIDNSQKELIRQIFNKTGHVYLFDDEEMIDKITPVSGSAVAYIFYLAEKMINSAVNLFDFKPDMAKEITLQVIEGALQMMRQNPQTSIEQLRQNVTSKKGATEQAINVFDKYEIQEILNLAEMACYNRTKELGGS